MSHYYFVTYRHATGYGSCEPLTMDTQLTTGRAMKAARISIARAIGQRDTDVVILFVMPLPDERYDVHQRAAHEHLQASLRGATS